MKSPWLKRKKEPEPPLVIEEVQNDAFWDANAPVDVAAVIVDGNTEADIAETFRAVESKGPFVPAGCGSVSTQARKRYVAEDMRHKSRLVATVLAVFLGMFGVHKFYLGYNQAGFIMMTVAIVGGILTFGLTTLVIWGLALIEAALYISKTQEDFDWWYVENQRDWL